MRCLTPTDHLNIHYLATFDSGNASFRWPQKNAREANARQDEYNEDISATLKLNLLWRPFVAIRHIELFDNLALAKFLVRYETEPGAALRLADNGLIQICSPSSSSFKDIFLAWANGKGSKEPMHWHHLDGERQRAYDDASRKGQLKGLKSIEKFLFLRDHHLSLSVMVAHYDLLFRADDIIVVGREHRLPTEWYANRVWQKWQKYRQERQKAAIPDTELTRAIEQTLEDCKNRGVRRRDFYTKIESLDELAHVKHASNITNLANELLETKCFVLNDAFYDEFQEFGNYKQGRSQGRANILASRDITNRLFPHVLPSRDDSKPLDVEQDSKISVPFAALEAFSFADIVEWHRATHEEARAFQSSIKKIEALHMSSRAETITENELANTVEEHLRNLESCARRTLRGRNALDKMEGTWSEVFLGVKPETAAALPSTGIAGIAYHVTGNLSNSGNVFGFCTKSFTYILRKTSAVKNEFKQLEALVGKEIRESIQGEH